MVRETRLQKVIKKEESGTKIKLKNEGAENNEPTGTIEKSGHKRYQARERMKIQEKKNMQKI